MGQIMPDVENIQLINCLKPSLELILFNTYIQFGGSIFKQLCGKPLVGKSSHVTADLYLSWCEYYYMNKAVRWLCNGKIAIM